MKSLGNINTKEKTKRDVKLLEKFFRNEKSDEREVQDIGCRIEQAPCGLYSFVRRHRNQRKKVEENAN